MCVLVLFTQCHVRSSAEVHHAICSRRIACGDRLAVTRMASEEYARDAGFSGPGELARIIDFASLWRLKILEVFRKSPSHVFVCVRSLAMLWKPHVLDSCMLLGCVAYAPRNMHIISVAYTSCVTTKVIPSEANALPSHNCLSAERSNTKHPATRLLTRRTMFLTICWKPSISFVVLVVVAVVHVDSFASQFPSSL